MELIQVYKILLKHFGKQYWWPADTPFEVIIGAILTQNTNWNNVRKVIDKLKEEKLLAPYLLDKADLRHLENITRSAGFYRQKASRIRNFTQYLRKHYNYNLNKFFAKPKMELREELLELKGIGKETADSIILYAAQKSIFVIDAYTKRMSHRLGITQIDDYENLRKFFEDRLPIDIKIYNEFHALIVELGKNYCKTKPLCYICPLKGRCKFMRGLENRQSKTFQIKLKKVHKKIISKKVKSNFSSRFNSLCSGCRSL